MLYINTYGGTPLNVATERPEILGLILIRCDIGLQKGMQNSEFNIRKAV